MKPLLVTDNGDGTGTLVVGIGSIAAGTNLIGKVGIDQVTTNANRVVICGVQGDGTVAAGVAGTGSGGAATAFNDDETLWVNGGNGGSGFVIFRYPMAQVFEDTLADTGPASAGLGWASAALVAFGVALTGASRRLRRVTMV